jgi:hypothetical protein
MKRRAALAVAWFGLVVTFLLSVGSSLGQSDGAVGKEKLRRLPEEVVKQWRAAGAAVGWLCVGEYGFIEFVGESRAKAGDLPGFRFPTWPGDGVTEKLPDPGVPFGVNLSDSRITDAGLKILTQLKNLQVLDLSSNRITDEGLIGLAGLKNLQLLDLSNTQITDVGLMRLAELKNLQSLDLRFTQVTDVGLKGLTGLKKLAQVKLGRYSSHRRRIEGIGSAQKPAMVGPDRCSNYRCRSQTTGATQKPTNARTRRHPSHGRGPSGAAKSLTGLSNHPLIQPATRNRESRRSFALGF